MLENIPVKELMLFDSESRRIYLNDKRVILMEADSLGALRRDLIAALGMDRAKAFLLRHGWDHGTNAARTFKSFLPMGKDADWLYAGPQIHEMTGNVRVEVSVLHFNPQTKAYYSEGFWHHSYEAEQHIKHFGIHHEPVCFTLVSFAGGYVSEHLGRRVIFKEIECVGRGDPRCHWIAKPVEDWGDDIQKELTYYSEDHLAIDLDKAYVRMERQKEILGQVLAIYQELARALLQQEQMQSVMSVLGRHLSVSIAFEDTSFRLVESYGTYREHRLSDFFQSNASRRAQLTRLRRDHQTIRLAVPQEVGWAHERLMAPIVVLNKVTGYLSLIKETGDFDEIERLCLKQAAIVWAISMMNERAAAKAEQRVKGQLMDELLIHSGNPESWIHRLRALGYAPDRPHRIYLIDIRSPADQAKGGPIDLSRNGQLPSEQQHQMIEMALPAVEKYIPSPMMSVHQDHFILLVPSDRLEQLSMTALTFGQILARDLSQECSGRMVCVGISSPQYHVTDYKRGYHEACKALATARARTSQPAIVSFEDLGLLARLAQDGDTEELRYFAFSVLGRLVQHDARHRGELLKTLYCFFEHKGNVLATAREMNLSAGSIKYRLQRIEEICHVRLSRAHDFYNTYQALQALLFLGEIKWQHEGLPNLPVPRF
ncbi:XylR N-terminal domain-containing protein [Alicyclobacillus shizuokensis]|uniref:XylR N-terminal domain-containing protein n=1 Tax=Alicyclobacillus shizuokensis TaxID=392014 RepID=UPI0008344B5B|nr:XylR N-terminal domain-containing protein [Alicyclobacillus shizuokensis]MCL6626488.1 XylR N-terminal domain-containing protein [Alicyclobacillus shizuokensis]